MATIKTTFGSGGSGLTPNKSVGTPSLATALRDVADDLDALFTSITGITAKLDADATVTDTNYAALHDPPAMLTIKG
jgi:hypothetical protein